MTLVVFTSITGNCPDRLLPVAAPPFDRPVLFVCFTEDLQHPPKGWLLRRLLYEHPDPRRAARWHKVLAHQSLAEFNPSFSLWHDGSHTLTAAPWTLVDDILDRPGSPVDLAAFRHPDRDCVYEELTACIALKKDRPQVMRRQVDAYRAGGFPEHAGLFETSALLRRHTPAVAAFERSWWGQIARGSVRDQLSINWTLSTAGLSAGVIPGDRVSSPFFQFRAHR